MRVGIGQRNSDFTGMVIKKDPQTKHCLLLFVDIDISNCLVVYV